MSTSKPWSDIDLQIQDWDNDREHGVWKGRITLTKDDVEQTFIEVVPRIESSCLTLTSGRKVEVSAFGCSSVGIDYSNDITSTCSSSVDLASRRISVGD